MNLNKIVVVLVLLIAGVFVAATESIAGKPDRCSPWPECKDDGGDPPPPPPPTGCTDIFPGFVYTQEATRKEPGEIHLASSDGCRNELVIVGPSYAQMHMTADRLNGVIVWVEDPGNVYQAIVRRLDFAVDTSGNLMLEPAVTILPLAGEEPLLGEQLYYEVGDVWGDATHDSLYITVSRIREHNSGPYAGKNFRDSLIYDLNDLTDISAVPPPLAPDVRTIYHHLGTNGETPESWEWLDGTIPTTLAECGDALYPQFIPTCYGAAGPKFNSSGTRLYFSQGVRGPLEDSQVTLWGATIRIDIDRETVGPDLADWIIGGPELVAVVDFRGSGGPTDLSPRPDVDPSTLPEPEIVARKDHFLDADQCAAQYAPFDDGNTLLSDDFWVACIDTSLFGHTGFGNGQVWESSNTYLYDRNAKHGSANIHRTTISGGSAGIEELLIENGRGMDTGL